MCLKILQYIQFLKATTNNMRKAFFLLAVLLCCCTDTKKKNHFYSEGEEICFTADPKKRGVIIFVKNPGATYRVAYFDVNGKSVEDIFAAYELCECR